MEVFDMVYKLGGLGGTFDHLHEGHKTLIKAAFNVAENVAIALTTDKLLTKKKFKNKIESYENRKENLLRFIANLNPDYLNHCQIIPLNDPFGTAITEPKLQIHISSEESYKNAMEINKIREKNGLPKVVLVIVPAVLSENGEKISSTQIRSKI